MPELIDKAKLLEYLSAIKPDEYVSAYGEAAVDVINYVEKYVAEMPTIEPEVRHGRWIEGQTDLICSVCKWKYSDELPFMSNNGLDSMTESFAHCPHCGARMNATDTNDGGKGGAENG